MILESALCLECGLCCNGALFERGELRPGDDPARLQSVGLRIRQGRSGNVPTRFDQPCGAFDRCGCTIYPERPAYCRMFECLLLQHVRTGTLSLEAAKKRVRLALRHVQHVRELLEKLGNSNERAPLSRRFRMVQRQLETQSASAETAALFSELTLAISDLNRTLRKHFVE